MPRVNPIWQFFKKHPQRHVTAAGKPTNYYKATCKACSEASEAADPVDKFEVKKEIGRVDALLSHFKTCPYISEETKATFLKHQSLKKNAPSGTSSIISSKSKGTAPNPEKEIDIANICSKYNVDRAAFEAISQFVKTEVIDRAEGSNKKRRLESGLSGWVVPKLTPNQVIQLHQNLLVMIADAAVAFRFVERESFIDLVRLLRPSAVNDIPSRRQLSGSILDEVSNFAKKETFSRLHALTNRGAYATLMVDGWKTVDNKHLLGSSLSIAGHVAVFETEEEGTDHHGLVQAIQLQRLILKADKQVEVNLSAVTTDDAPQVARARRILALRFTSLIFLKCWAHQIVCSHFCEPTALGLTLVLFLESSHETSIEGLEVFCDYFTGSESCRFSVEVFVQISCSCKAGNAAALRSELGSADGVRYSVEFSSDVSGVTFARSVRFAIVCNG